MAPSKSAVWGYFERLPSNKVKCKQCSKELNYKNTTSNLIAHLSGVHKITVQTLPPTNKKRRIPEEEEDEEVTVVAVDTDAHQQEKRPRLHENAIVRPLDKCINNFYSFSRGGARDVQCTNALMYMVAKDNLPLDLPNRKGFKKFVNILQPLYKPPSEPTLTKGLQTKYEALRVKVGRMMEGAEHITLTMDLWTNKYTTKGYLGVTAHFTIGSKTTSVELGARLMEERKTAVNLQEAIRDLCTDWRVDYTKVRAVVTDGGANIKLAAKQEFGNDKHISCLNHRLNLIGQKVIGNSAVPPSEQETPPPEIPDDEEEISDEEEEAEEHDENGTSLRGLIKKVKRTVRFFKKSEIASTRLNELQRDEGKSDGSCLKLIQEVKTRWNSCYDMIERYLKLAPLVNRVVLELQRSRASKSRPPEIISADEEDTLKVTMELLAPLARATKELSYEKLVTLSKAIPVIRNIRREIDEVAASTPLSFNLQKHLSGLLKDNFGKLEDVNMFAAATLLDPRFKKFGFRQDATTPRRVAKAMSYVGELIKEEMRRAEAGALAANPAGDGAADAVLDEGGASGSSDSFWEKFDREIEQQASLHSGQDVAGGVPIQLRMFLDAAPVKRKDFPNPLDAWESIKGEYKFVYPVAQRFLSILATSVPAERLFSHAGLILQQRRTRLTGKKVEMLVFLRSCDDSLWFDN